MDYSLSEVFERHFEHTKFDAKLARKVYEFQVWLSTKNQEHTQFFGSNLLGCHVLRFLPKEVLGFFDRVIEIDYVLLEKDIRKLTTIYHENSISGDIFNLTMMYMIHRFYQSTALDVKRRMRAAFDVAMIFCYRSVIALTNNYFTYAADPKIAQAAYSSLSNQNLIKKLGTWKKVCEYRAEEMTSKTGIVYERLFLFNDDITITNIIQDQQGRFRSIINLYYDKFDTIHSNGESVGVTSATLTDVDGDVVLRERTKSVENLIHQARSSLSDPNGFIQADLVTVVAEMNSNSSYRMIRATLEWMAKSYADPTWNPAIDKFVTDVIVQSMFYIGKHVSINHRKNLPVILKTLKDLYLATQSQDPDLLSIRKQGEKIMKGFNPQISATLMTSTRTAVILYFTLRCLVGQQT